MTQAGLWTDGRYFIQAEKQLEGTTVTLFRMGQEGVPTICEYLKDQLPQGGCIGFDGRVMNTMLGKEYFAIAKDKGGKLYTSEDLIDLIWTDRPQIPAAKTQVLEEKYSGEAFAHKLERVRKQMTECNAQAHIMSCLYDIAWFFNMRGGDIESVPVFLSYALITLDEVKLYLNEKVLSEQTAESLKENGVVVRPYNAISEDVKLLADNTSVLLNEAQVNYSIYSNLPSGVTVVNLANPAEDMKSRKNEVELANLVQAHIKDGLAFTKFMYWVKKNIGKITL